MCKHSWQKIEVPQTVDLSYDEVTMMKEQGTFASILANVFGRRNFEADGATVIAYVRIGRKCTKCDKTVKYPNWC